MRNKKSQIEFHGIVTMMSLFGDLLSFEKISETIIWDKVPSDYTLPKFLTFTFREYCFRNNWSITWDGKNVQSKSNSKIIKNK